MMTTRSIRNNFCACKTEINMWIPRNPNLFTNLACNYGILALNHCDTHRSCLLSFDVLDTNRKLKIMQIISMFPWFEPSSLSVIVSMCQVQFWAHEQNLLIEAEHTTIIKGALIHNWHANITKNVLSEGRITQDILKYFPRMHLGVRLEEVIFAGVARNFHFWPKSITNSFLFTYLNRLDDVLLVCLEAHGPLVKLTNSNLCILFMQT